jgi:hypothetical protein
VLCSISRLVVSGAANGFDKDNLGALAAEVLVAPAAATVRLVTIGSYPLYRIIGILSRALSLAL